MRVSLSRNSRSFAVVVLIFFAVGCKKEQKKDPAPDSVPAPGNNSGGGTPPVGSGTPAAPAGWQEGRDTVGGYKMLLPGPVIYHENTAHMTNVGQELKATLLTHATQNPEKETTVRGVSSLLAAGEKLGSTPDEYYATFLAGRATLLTYNEVLVKSVVTLGGRPAVKLVVKAKATDQPLPADPEFRKDEIERRKQKDAKRTTYFLTANNNRIVQVQINTLGEPDAALLNTIIESFRFL